MLKREIIITYDTDQGHITNIFQDRLGGNLEYFKSASSSEKMIVDKQQWLDLVKDKPSLMMLYQNGSVGKESQGSNLTILTIPKDAIFKPLREEASVMAQEVSTVEGKHSIVMPIEVMKDLLDKAEDHDVRNFKSALHNSEAEAAELLIRSSVIGRAQFFRTPMTADAMVSYVKGGNYTKPEFDYDSLYEWKDRFEAAKPWAIAGAILAATLAVGWCAVKLGQIGKRFIDNNNNNIQIYMDDGDNVSVDPKERGIFQLSEGEYEAALAETKLEKKPRPAHEEITAKPKKTNQEFAARSKTGDLGKAA